MFLRPPFSRSRIRCPAGLGSERCPLRSDARSDARSGATRRGSISMVMTQVLNSMFSDLSNITWNNATILILNLRVTMPRYSATTTSQMTSAAVTGGIPCTVFCFGYVLVSLTLELNNVSITARNLTLLMGSGTTPSTTLPSSLGPRVVFSSALPLSNAHLTACSSSILWIYCVRHCIFES